MKRKLQVTTEVKDGNESDIAKWKSKVKVEVKWQMEMESESVDDSGMHK